MKNTIKMLRLFFLFCVQLMVAQSAPVVNVTVQVLPPYSSYLSDYVNSSNKVVLTLQSYSNASVKLKATISGDNGITVTTSDSYRPASPIQLQAYQQKMLTGLDLRNYLDFNSTVVTGVNKNELFRGSGIPEGNYTLCIQVLDYNTGNPLSSPEPLGCSNMFSIEQLTPPQLIAPRCDEAILAGNIQNVIFSWLPPAGAPPGSQYKLKIVELNPSTRNPNDAMNSATTPAFFETTLSSFTFLYGPAQPALKKGKKYAWRVSLLPAMTRASATGTPTLNVQNKGNSEVCSFEYQENKAVVTTMPVSNGISLIKPVKGEKISNGYGLEFSWSASSKPIKKYQLQFTDRISQDVKITDWNNLTESLFSANGFFASKDVGLNLSQALPPTFTSGNGKIAWRIVGMDSQDNIIDKSNIETYEVVDAPLSDRIKLLSPSSGKQISGGENMTYFWTASKKKTVKEYLIQWKYIKSKNEVSEKLFSDTDFNGAIGPFTNTQFSLKTQVDQQKQLMAWRVIGIANGKLVDSSLPDYVDFVEDTSELVNLKTLQINGYTIQITKVNDKNQDSFAGQGKILLWEGGPEAVVWFDNLKIRPIVYYPKLKKYAWAVISGNIDMPFNKAFPFSPYGKIKLGTEKNSEGEFELQIKSLSFKANLKGTENTDTKLFKVDQDLGTTTSQATSKWYSNFFIWKVGSSSTSDQYVFESAAEGTLSMSFVNKFDGEIVMKNQKMTNLENKGIEVTFANVNGIKMQVKGLQAGTQLSGDVSIPNAKPFGSTMTALHIPFKESPNLNFPYSFDSPLQWKMNADGSVWANVASAYVHLSDEGQLDKKFEYYNNGLNFDKFGVEVKMPAKPGETKQSSLNLNFDNIYHDGKGYSNNKKGEVVVKSNVNIAGFASKLKKCEFLIKSSKLAMLNVSGDLFVPFLNDWAALNMSIDDQKIQESNVSFDYEKKYYLAKDQSGDYAYIKISLGRLEGNAVVVQSNLTIKNSENKGFETQNMSMCDLYINGNGTVSYDSNFNLNSESTCEGSKKWATYYRFTYGIDKMKIKRNNSKTDALFLFTGDVILGENIATNDKKEMGFLYHGTTVNPDSGEFNNAYNANQQPNMNGGVSVPKGIKGPSQDDRVYYTNTLENSLEIADDGKAINGGYEDGAQKFGGGFKIKTNDPTWGNYFELGGYYEAKEPDAKSLEAKMILGKTLASSGKYTYWFFEFKQKGMVSIPIVPGIIEAHGFGGKAYYHIEPTYNNLGQITDMKPNDGYSLGIVAEADVRTAYDNGATLHGHVQINTQFKGWSIDGIDYYIKADAIAQNSDNPGLVQARMNGKLNWMDKYIDGQGQIWGKVKDIVCINEGDANEDSVFFHFGANDFYLNVGTQDNPITAEVMCGSGMSMGVWLGFNKERMELGLAEHYDSGWKGLDLGVASAKGRLVSNLSGSLKVQYSPFQATGTARFDGSAYGKGCIKWIGCVGGSCSASADLSVSMPNPMVVEGSVSCDVSRWIPDFTLHARWSSNGGFSIWV